MATCGAKPTIYKLKEGIEGNDLEEPNEEFQREPSNANILQRDQPRLWIIGWPINKLQKRGWGKYKMRKNFW